MNAPPPPGVPVWVWIALGFGGVIGSTLTVVGTYLTVRGNRKVAQVQATQATSASSLASIDRRIEEAFDAKDRIILDQRTELDRLIARIGAMETARTAAQDQTDAQIRDLATRLDSATRRVEAVSQAERELRAWAGQMSTWASTALETINQLGGTIASPPPLPPERDT